MRSSGTSSQRSPTRTNTCGVCRSAWARRRSCFAASQAKQEGDSPRSDSFGRLVDASATVLMRQADSRGFEPAAQRRATARSRVGQRPRTGDRGRAVRLRAASVATSAGAVHLLRAAPTEAGAGQRQGELHRFSRHAPDLRRQRRTRIDLDSDNVRRYGIALPDRDAGSRGRGECCPRATRTDGRHGGRPRREPTVLLLARHGLGVQLERHLYEKQH